MSTTRKTITALLVATIGIVAVANPAGAAATGWYGRYVTSTNFTAGTNGYAKWWANDCGNNAPYVRPGSQGVVTENGQSGIVAMKVQYLYQIPNYTGGWSNYLQSQTYQSSTFPNNATSYTYTAPFHRFGNFVPPDGGRLAIKFTWVRNNATDVNWTQAVAYC